jgi:hypothetical protein
MAPAHGHLGRPRRPAYFSCGKPSDQFASFAHPQIATVGAELDHKMAALREHLGAGVPDRLITG